MPEISKRGQLMPNSPIRKLVPLAEEANKRGIKVYKLNIGQPDIETSPEAIKAIKNFSASIIDYGHSSGNESLRKKFAKYYDSINIPVKYQDIIITTGGSEAVLFAMQSCLDPGDEIITPEPFYANYNGFAINAGVNIVPVVSHIEDGFALPPIQDFEKLITPKTKAILICNPNNPTGYLYSQQELELLKELVRKYDLYLFADEVYREFCYDDKKHFSVMHFTDISDNVVLIDSVSKRYSACGIRIGALISKNKKLINTVMKFAQARLSPPTLGQIAAEAAIDTPKSYFDSVINEYIARRNLVVESINNIEGAFCPVPTGAFYAFARLPVDNCDNFCQWLLESFSYHNETVMLAPGTGFYSSPNKGINEVRISYVLNVEDLKKAMICLKEALKVYPGRK